MIAYSPIRTCVRYMARTSGSMKRLIPRSTFGPYCFHLRANYVAKSNPCQSLIRSDIAKQRSNRKSLPFTNLVYARRWQEKSCLDISLRCVNMNLRLLFLQQGISSRTKSSLAPLSWMHGCALAGLVVGLSFYSSMSEPALCFSHAEAKPSSKDNLNSLTGNLSHGKQVETNYSVIGIQGDGRCLFRSIAHGACVRSGKPAPNESHQRELADELRDKVADEFVKRRKETEWFIEGDFDAYISQIRKTHVWGGEPELLMASHVLKMPITVYMSDPDSGGLVSIAEYGLEYSKEDPIRVLYHGSGHYDALHIPINKDPRSRL